MLVHGAAGRWLDGRPNYGHQLVDTDVPHPQRQTIASCDLRVMRPRTELREIPEPRIRLALSGLVRLRETRCSLLFP
jgi:hypothetical protein